MTLGMTLVYPVQWGVAIRGHTAHTVRLPDVLLCRAFCLQFAKLFFGVLPRRKKISKTPNKMLKFVNFP